MTFDGSQLELARPAWLLTLALGPWLIYLAARGLVGASRGRRAAALALRVLLLAALAIALSGPRLVGPSRERRVVLVVDPALVRAADARRAAEDFAAAVRAASDGVEVAVAAEQTSSTTNSSLALAQARAAIPAHASAALVLLSDGHVPSTETIAAAQAAGLPVSTIPLPARHGERVTLTEQLSTSATVLFVGNAPATRLVEALRADHITVETCRPQALTAARQELDRFDLIMLVNVPAAALSAQQVAALDWLVGRRGGGLIVTGGDQSFTPGGYQGSRLEALLPAVAEIKKKDDKPEAALVLVIDRSESMRGASIELARQAARRAVETLDPRDQVGILVFDETSRWVAPLQRVGDKRGLLETIGTIEAGGRTNLHPALEKAFLALREAFADTRHVIALTDGISHPADFHGLARRIAAAGITMSTVALGQEAAGPLLEQMAEIGGGRYYFVRAAEAIPSIFAQEARRASQVGISEGPSFARLQQPSLALSGLAIDQAPSLLGYVETRPRPESQVWLVSEAGDPILVRGRHGLGATVVFASTVEGRWSAAWLTWDGYDRFWQRLVRDALRRDRLPRLSLEVFEQEGQRVAALDAFGDQGQFLHDATARLTLAEASGSLFELDLPQIAPGRYATRLPPLPPARYAFRVEFLGPDDEPTRRAWTLEIGQTTTRLPPNVALLRALASASGGRFDPPPKDVLSHLSPPGQQSVSLWPYALAAALLLFLLDAAARSGLRVGRVESQSTAVDQG